MKVYYSDGKLIMMAPLEDNTTFKVKINLVDHMCLALTEEEDKNWLWKHRYGHLNFKIFGMVNQKKMVYGLPQVNKPSQVCEECCKVK
jgi:hypothetical protein